MTVGRDAIRLGEWQRQFELRGETPAIPAATVVVLRDGGEGIETLMLHRASRIAFGGMWVFPGGRIDPDDHLDTADVLQAARNAAVREAREEADIVVDAATLVHFSYWLPPAIAPKRFATWFFAARADATDVTVDDGEIIHHEWMTPVSALARRDAGDIELAPPTWVSLNTLTSFTTVTEALAAIALRRPRQYETRVGHSQDGPVAMWSGDAGYVSGDPATPGAKHRLTMSVTGYRFEESGRRDPEDRINLRV